MISGSITNIVWELFALQNASGLHPFLAGLIASLIAMLVGNQFGTPPSDPILEAYDLAKQSKDIPKNLEKGIFEDLAPEARNISKFIQDQDNTNPVESKRDKDIKIEPEIGLRLEG